MPNQWYVRTSKADRGPYSTAKLRKLADGGKIKPETLVGRDGKKWIEAGKVRGLNFGVKKRKPKPTGTKAEQPDHTPWYEGQEEADTAKHLANLDTAQLGERMSDGSNYYLARLQFAGTAASILPAFAYGLVRLAYFFGWLHATSSSSTLAWRIVLPAVVFAASFGFCYWIFDGEGFDGNIDADMTDEDILDRL